MKQYTTLIFIFFLAIPLFGQEKIDSNNYYEYFSDGKGLKGTRLKTSWITEEEASKILEEEMKSFGFEWLSKNRIIKLGDGKYISSMLYSEKAKFGFLYEGSHDMFPSKETRNSVSLIRKTNGYDYSEKIVDLNGKAEFIRVEKVPENLFIVKEDIYWYQVSDSKEDLLVSKRKMIEIFKQDIREVLKKIKR